MDDGEGSGEMQTLTQTTAEPCGCVWNTTTARRMNGCTRHLAIDALKATQELLGRLHTEAVTAARNDQQYSLDCIKLDVTQCNRAIGSLSAIIRKMPTSSEG